MTKYKPDFKAKIVHEYLTTPQSSRALGRKYSISCLLYTSRQAREVFAAFLGTTIDKIDNSNFKKTHNHLFKEVGAATLNHSGRPPKLYQLN